jgi:hypothetical protein
MKWLVDHKIAKRIDKENEYLRYYI